MLNQEHDSITLMQQQANQSIVDGLFRRGFINQQARDCVLELLYPHLNWGAFTTRFLGILGCLFIISGLVFYFAFNWESMSGSYKLRTLEAGIICCMAGAWAFTLSKLSGQLFLTAGCVLVGIFMAVFGQIYQTGADNYELFAVWALLIIPFVLISQFAALWYLWLVIINLAIGFYWLQAATISIDAWYFLFFILIVLNGCFLALREFAQNKQIARCQGRWHRILLVLNILIIAMPPIINLIWSNGGGEWENGYLIASALLGLIVHGVFIYYYRFKTCDMWAVGATIASLCIIFQAAFFELFDRTISSQELKWLMMSVSTLVVFTLGAFILNKLTPKLTNQEKLL